MLAEFAERKAGIGAAILGAGRKRAANVAGQLSRRGRMKASAELCNEAVGQLIGLCYESDTDGKAANLDSTGRILVALPWGGIGHTYYGLRSTEQKALRRYMFGLAGGKGGDLPLFTYDGDTRSWYLNIWDYPRRADALGYWQRWGLGEAAYRQSLG